MRLIYSISALMLALGIAACTDDVPAAQQRQMGADPVALQAHLEFLASDELEGRDTGSRGHEIAAQYVATEFKRLGLEPGGDENTYYQRIQFRRSYLIENSVAMTVTNGTETIEMQYPKQFITGPSAYSEQDDIEAPLVFVGYGCVWHRRLPRVGCDRQNRRHVDRPS